MGKRRLFCEWGPAAYWLSTQRCRLQRRLSDAVKQTAFAEEKGGLLPVCVYRHSSLICRTLGDVDARLQKNKETNLRLAVPHIDGILLRPGQTFSFWKLVGACTRKKGYLEGLVIRGGKPDRDVGGGMCQFTNLLHWMVLHTPLTVTEYHHHDGVDLFPDFGRKVPFGVGTSILYNYLDYRVFNGTDQAFQFHVWIEDGNLCGQVRCERPLPVKYHIAVQEERFVREEDGVYRCNTILRRCVDKRTGQQLSCQVLKKNHARVLYEIDLSGSGEEPDRQPGRLSLESGSGATGKERKDLLTKVK